MNALMDCDRVENNYFSLSKEIVDFSLLINVDCIFFILKNLDFYNLKKMSLLSKKWEKLVKHPELKLNLGKMVIKFLLNHSVIYLFDSLRIGRSVLRLDNYCIKINGKVYKPKEPLMSIYKKQEYFNVVFKDQKLSLTTSQSKEIFHLKRELITVETVDRANKRFHGRRLGRLGHLVVKWTLQSFDTLLNEPGFTDKIQLDLKKLNQKIEIIRRYDNFFI